MVGGKVWVGEFGVFLAVLLDKLCVVGFHDLFDDCVLVVFGDLLQVGVAGFDALLWSVVDELAEDT